MANAVVLLVRSALIFVESMFFFSLLLPLRILFCFKLKTFQLIRSFGRSLICSIVLWLWRSVLTVNIFEKNIASKSPCVFLSLFFPNWSIFSSALRLSNCRYAHYLSATKNNNSHNAPTNTTTPTILKKKKKIVYYQNAQPIVQKITKVSILISTATILIQSFQYVRFHNMCKIQ